MRHKLRSILTGLAVTSLLAGVGLAVTATAANAQPTSGASLAPGFHPIKNVGHGLCLQPEGGSTAEDAAIVQMPCDRANAAQLWLQQRVGTHHYTFLNQASLLCFDAADIVNGARVRQGVCRGISNQEFNTGVDLPAVTFIESRIHFRDTGFCLDAPGAGAPTVGLAMQMWRCNGTPPQQWFVGFDVN